MIGRLSRAFGFAPRARSSFTTSAASSLSTSLGEGLLNIGPSVWCDGRIVGGWAQRPSGEVVFRLLEVLGRAAKAAIEQEADRLARVEVMAARELDGASWSDVGEALGMTRQAAHERFRTGPDGFHSRWYKLRSKG